MITDDEFKINPVDGFEIDPISDWNNPATTSLKKLFDWVLVSLGAPLVTVELAQEQLNLCVQNALEKYTKYAYFGPDQYLVVNLKKYEPGKGLNLKEFNITSIKDMSFQRDNAFAMTGDIFWSAYSFLGQAGFPFLNNGGGNFVGAWTTWHNVHEFFELSKRMTGSNPDWQYDKTTGYLKIMPEPNVKNDQLALCTCQKIPPISQLLGNEYVKRLTLAYAKILLGTVRKKFTGISLPGGGQIDTSIGEEGKAELTELINNIIRDEAKGQGAWII